MWKNFQKALEKRVRNDKQVKILDRFDILKTVEFVLNENYGRLGTRQIQVISVESGMVELKVDKSIWRTELELEKELLIKKINQILGCRHISRLIIRS